MKKKELIQEAVNKLKEIAKNTDAERGHIEADKVLCELLKKLGCKDVVVEYDKIFKWYA